MTDAAPLQDSFVRRHGVMAILIVLTTALAGFAWYTKAATWIEAIAFVTGALGVWLVVRQSIWNFPLGIINVALYSYIFYQYRLFADAGLQIMFFVLQFVGWYMWLYGGRDRTRLDVQVTGTQEKIAIGAFIVLGTAGVAYLLTLARGALPFWDSFTTVISVAAQWLLSRKKLESWYLWIFVDIIYVPLYVSRGLYLTAVLYAVFLVMAIIGLLAWRMSWKENSVPTAFA